MLQGPTISKRYISEPCPNHTFTEDEHAMLKMPDAAVSALGKAAQEDDEKALERLLTWFFILALNYYCWKASKRGSFSDDDADDLVGDLLLKFIKALPRIRKIPHFARSLLNKSLKGYLREKKKKKEVVQDPPDRTVNLDTSPLSTYDRRWRMDDEELLQYRIMLRVRDKAEEKMKEILRLTYGETPLTSEQIAEKLDMTSGAVRMRLTHFRAKVRREYKALMEARAGNQLPPEK